MRRRPRPRGPRPPHFYHPPSSRSQQCSSRCGQPAHRCCLEHPLVRCAPIRPHRHRRGGLLRPEPNPPGSAVNLYFPLVLLLPRLLHPVGPDVDDVRHHVMLGCLSRRLRKLRWPSTFPPATMHCDDVLFDLASPAMWTASLIPSRTYLFHILSMFHEIWRFSYKPGTLKNAQNSHDDVPFWFIENFMQWMACHHVLLSWTLCPWAASSCDTDVAFRLHRKHNKRKDGF